MNFKELMGKLESIANDPNSDQQANNQQPNTQQPAAPDNSPKPIPGQQPSLGTKTMQPTAQQMQAMQYPNQKPAPQAVAPTDPKADITAMTQALQAMAMQNKQPAVQPTTSASVNQQQVNAPKQVTSPKPGEPVKEDDQLDENREEKIKAWKDWLAKNPGKINDVPEKIRAQTQEKYTQDLGTRFAQETDPAKKEKLKQEFVAQADILKTFQTPDKFPKDGSKDADAKKSDAPQKRQWAPGTFGKGSGMSGTGDVQVAALQKKLQSAGYDLGSTGVDGKYGPRTAEAVKKFQKDVGLTPDGVAGPQTLPKIMDIPVASAADGTTGSSNARADTTKGPNMGQDKETFGLTSNANLFNFTPEQEKWLGNANRSDPNILARMPGEKPPLSYFTNPEDRARAIELNQGEKNLTSLKNMFGGKNKYNDVFRDVQQAEPANTDQTAMDAEIDKATAELTQQQQAQNVVQPGSNTAPGSKPNANASLGRARPNADGSAPTLNDKPAEPVAPEGGRQYYKLPGNINDIKEEVSTELQKVVQELNEWSLGDKIHPDVDYSWGDAATDVALTGAGVLATGLTGGAAGPAAAALTGGRAARLGSKVYQAGKNIFTGTKAAATNPAVAKELGAKTAKFSAAAVPASAASGHALNKVLPDDSVEQNTREELVRIKELMKKV
jgi:peptidoglycan hydrolase-like protein with peptidoglycan-binding domain